ncbi:helicase [Bacteroidia bacterium]|nr:helicase [Bacteroidia bacterium]
MVDTVINNAQKQSSFRHFVLIISEHPQFGWKLSLHLAEHQKSGSCYLSGIPNYKEEAANNRDETELLLIRAIEEISEKALIKAYCREQDKTKIPQTTLDNLIRPRIERQCSKILQLALATDTPVFFRQNIKVKSFSESNQVEILSEPSRCVFNFIKDENGLRYFISLTNNEKETELQQETAIILSEEPCIVLLAKQIHQVNDIEAKKLKPFFTKTHIQVPATSEKEYIQKFVLKTIPKYEVKIEGIDMIEKQPIKQAILILEEDFYQRLCLSLVFQYDDRRFEAASVKKKKIVSVEERNGAETIVWLERDIAWENQCAEYLSETGLKKEGDHRFYLPNQSEILQKYGLIGWLNRHSDELKEFQIEQQTIREYYNGTVSVQSQVDEKIDWFEMKIEVVLGDHLKIPFTRFRKHILNGNPEFVLPDGRIFILPEEWFSRYQEVMMYSESDEQMLRLRKIHGHLLNETNEILQPVDNPVDLFKQPTVLPEIPAHLESILRPYQKQGFYWLNHLYELRFGGCLADDMGLGKTLQTIALLDFIYSKKTSESPLQDFLQGEGQLSLFNQWDSPAKGHLPASLVVVPTSLLHNWKNELKKFAPGLKVYIHAGIKRLKTKEIGKIFKHYQIIITSYGMVRSDLDYLKNYDFLYLILDESQSIKNPDSISYQAVKQLKSTHRLALTGTPIENSLNDLWAQFNFINPGLLGSFSSFKTNYINKITKEYNQPAETALLKLIRPFLLRRTKEEVAPDLPPLFQEIVYCDMTESQEMLYEKEKNNIRNHLLENKEMFAKNKLMALQSLMRLRLLANHPALGIPSYTGDAGKFDQILMYFETIRESKHKVLIFSSFVKHLKLLAQAFDDKAWKYAWLTGETQDRETEIDRFNRNNDVQCFFISLKAGGVGLNLTAADYVFIIDPWWNPAAEMQALSRAHRIGQDKSVMVYRFISTQSIEEKILHLQAAKQKLSATFVASNNPLDDLDSNEIISLLDA